MLDIGWMELMVIGVVALMVVGPKELPALLRTIGRYVGMAKRQADEFRAQFDEAIRESEFDDIRKEVDNIRSGRFDEPGKSEPQAAPSDETKVDFEDQGKIEPAEEFRDDEETTSFVMSDGTVVTKDVVTRQNNGADEPAQPGAAAQEAAPAANSSGDDTRPAADRSDNDQSDGDRPRNAETVR